MMSAWARASKHRLALLCLLPGLLAGAPRVAAEETAGTALAGLLQRYDAPGGVLALSGPDGIPRIAAAGLADRAKGIPVTPDTRFHTASTGKMMTAVAVMQLVQAGRLALTDPALPLVDLPGVERLANLRTATVADLLTHRSGIPDCLRNAAAVTARHPGPRWTVAEALTEAPCGKPTKPGLYAYSNTNYMLLGRIVERMDGTGLAEALAARVFRPAGMTATSLGADPADPEVAHGYRAPKPDGSRADASLTAYSSPLGDAPVTTTAGDLERFMTRCSAGRGCCSTRRCCGRCWWTGPATPRTAMATASWSRTAISARNTAIPAGSPVSAPRRGTTRSATASSS